MRARLAAWALAASALAPTCPSALAEPAAPAAQGEAHMRKGPQERGPQERGPHGHGQGHHHRFDNPVELEERWEGPRRDAEQRPAEVLSFCGVAPGHTAVDLGAGTGYFVPHLARAVGEGGRVIALDVEPKMVEWLTARISREGLSRAEARLARPSDPTLAPASVDRVLVVNVWHHLDDRAAYLARLVSALRPGGRVCLVEIKPEAPFGPPARYRLTPEALKAELAASTALAVGAEVLSLEHQYVVVATLKP